MPSASLFSLRRLVNAEYIWFCAPKRIFSSEANQNVLNVAPPQLLLFPAKRKTQTSNQTKNFVLKWTKLFQGIRFSCTRIILTLSQCCSFCSCLFFHLPFSKAMFNALLKCWFVSVLMSSMLVTPWKKITSSIWAICSTTSLFWCILSDLHFQVPGSWNFQVLYVLPKALKAIMVILRCLQLSRVFSLLLFKIKYLCSYSPGQVEKFVKDLCFWIGNFMREMFRTCRGSQLTFHLQLVFIKLPKSNSLLQDGHFISVHSLSFKTSALIQ